MGSVVDYAASNASGLEAPPAGLLAAVLEPIWKFLFEARYEIFLFAVAIVAHTLLFGRTIRRPAKHQGTAAKARGMPEASAPRVARVPSGGQLGRTLGLAHEAGDHRQVLRCWSTGKRLARAPEVPLAPVVEAMRRAKKDEACIVAELREHLRRSACRGDASAVNDLLDALAGRLDSSLAHKVVAMMPSAGLRPDQRTYEAMLGLHFALRDFAEVRRVAALAKSEGVPLTTRAATIVIKAAMKADRCEEAIHHFRQLRDLWGHGEAGHGPSPAPRHVVWQLVELACKEGQLAAFLPALVGVPLAEEAVGLLLADCARRQDAGLSREVEKLARAQGSAGLSDANYALLVRAVASDPGRVRELFEEVAASRSTLPQDLALALLAACGRTGNTSLAARMADRLQPDAPQLLGAFVRLFAEAEESERACDVYERALAKRGGQAGALQLDSRTEKVLMNAAIRCGRSELAKAFMDAAPCDISRHITMIRNCASEGKLQGAHDVFESLQRCGVELNSVVYNTVLDACVECRDLKRAEAWMCRTKEAGMADVVSYNTLIKAYLHSENFAKARQLMDEMRGAGLQPNRVTFNELVNAMVVKKAKSHSGEVWKVLDEMRAAGLSPNQVTCSILLKSLNASSSEADVDRAMDLIGSMEERMDEVLLSSVVEACVRVGRPELLSSKLKQLQEGFGANVTGSHTFGSLIKAYGHAKDIKGVWRCWSEMRSRHVRPTSITAGCMVEAVVSNGDTEGAYDLVRQMQQDEQCRGILNSVVYCSILKGFTRERRLDRVWTVFKEMLSQDVDLSVVTFNTVLDACARCGSMDQVPKLLADMRSAGVKANIITYSTMIKGYCQKGQVPRAFSVIEEMRRETDLKPDEIMYNSLLDGCAQSNLVDEGLQLLQQMQAEGVPPSNFTLSLLVKLMSRARRLDTAFQLVEDVSTKYGFRPNVHVLTNLIQACVSNRQLRRGLDTWEGMIRDRVPPDSRTYAVLLRACLSQGRPERAEELLRSALGLGGAPGAVCGNLDSAVVNEALVGISDRGASGPAIALLTEIKRARPRVRIDAATQRRLVQGGCLDSEPRSEPASQSRTRGR